MLNFQLSGFAGTLDNSLDNQEPLIENAEFLVHKTKLNASSTKIATLVSNHM